jgi:hypothetical protein
MHRNTIKSWHRRMAAESFHLKGMEQSWRCPPEQLKGRQDLLDFTAYMATSSLEGYVERYDDLIFARDVPNSLKVEAAANRRIARDLLAAIEPASQRFRVRMAKDQIAAPPDQCQ